MTQRHTGVMTAERFQAIVDAYGAQPAHWPAAERQAAIDFASANVEAQSVMAQARALDAWLETARDADHARADADQVVFEAAIDRFGADFGDAAPLGDNVVSFPNTVALRPRRVPWSIAWGVGIGLAACIAGAVLGVNLSLMSLTDLRAQTVLEQVAMIDTGE